LIENIEIKIAFNNAQTFKYCRRVDNNQTLYIELTTNFRFVE